MPMRSWLIARHRVWKNTVRNTAIEELRKIPEVDKVSACYDLPISGMSGNNVSLPGDDRELV